ncbi:MULTISPECIES: hypothetical protein [Moorena]|nr:MULTISPECIES: hypothetical protein [Moorena]NEQ16422.1 hypothetical protein [Moorena sp. SIO3E2]NES40898.1 hypothetical protein [Moorena sp. SIO2C4]NET66400.1 hypothetical protein [Moorena sp. SIO1G6]
MASIWAMGLVGAFGRSVLVSLFPPSGSVLLNYKVTSMVGNAQFSRSIKDESNKQQGTI